MNKEKIAVLVDSGTDVEKDYKENLFVVPLIINIDNESYVDEEEIKLEEVLDKLDDHEITTSLPATDAILEMLDEIKEKGYEKLIIVSISSGLSGTHNIFRMIIKDYEGLEISLVDSKNISKASGYVAYQALELIDEGKEFNEIVETLNNSLDKQKVFFTIESAEYLRRGGRIGLVAGAIANVLNIKPIISCNDEGVYHSVRKRRGYQRAISTLLDLTKAFVEDAIVYDLTVLVAKMSERVEETIEKVKEMFSRVRNFEVKSVTPSLAIHTGPEAFGLTARIIK